MFHTTAALLLLILIAACGCDNKPSAPSPSTGASGESDVCQLVTAAEAGATRSVIPRWRRGYVGTFCQTAVVRIVR